MKQVIQNLRDGSVEVVDAPLPQCGGGSLRIATSLTLISAGTERMMLSFGRANWLQKARQQPDKVRMVLEKARTDGVLATYEAVKSKLDQPLAPGYCNVGRVENVGSGVSGFAVGDRVVSNGKHAELVTVPVNLCAKVPERVSDEDAAFTVVGAIALQGIRLAAPTLGETVAVMGLGLIGQLAVQLLRANGCQVIGFDFDPAKVAMAESFGAKGVALGDDVDAVAQAMAFSKERGIDAVLITAATDSDEPVRNAARMCRQRGRIVLVGVAGLNLSRADFYEKELTFQVSCSYGPGRYDPQYEEGGQDYPYGLVRWTEQRNFEAFLQVLADGKLDLAPLRTGEFPVERAGEAYALIGSGEPCLGVMLRFAGSGEAHVPAPASVALSANRAQDDQPAMTRGGVVNFVGAGSYAGSVLIPAFKAAGAQLNAVASSGGLSAVTLGRKFGFASASSDSAAMIADPAADCIVITTRHDSHARLAIEAIRNGKRVFVEKPLALSHAEIDEIECACRDTGHADAVLMVGFNRRFSPFAQRMKALLAHTPGPRAMTMTVNAGAIPADHWVHDPSAGGGRIVGEACHFVDLLRYLAGSQITAAGATGMRGGTKDTAVLTLSFADGSIGTIQYFANGNKAVAKERLEVFSAGRILALDNFRKLSAHGWARGAGLSTLRQDKGQQACAAAFLAAAKAGGPSPIPLAELLEVSRISIDLAEQLRA
ncbi:bi-domain-containing oxidoreductase [Qipengyuania sediminis]|uniref:bi-domain-containing oxidoreductase n=1 Tax=Qipengyuania sediminis TaxID=1532023 RepID=UPI001059DBEF|nr:bi-domain-containing oxidoreductase [Qipengyuania sediminis]